MIVDNPTILMFGVFAGVIIIFATIAIAIGVFGSANKVTQGRLSKIKGRHNKDAAIVQKR